MAPPRHPVPAEVPDALSRMFDEFDGGAILHFLLAAEISREEAFRAELMVEKDVVVLEVICARCCTGWN